MASFKLNAQFVESATVRFQGPSGKATFAYSCNEDDQPQVQLILRGLL